MRPLPGTEFTAAASMTIRDVDAQNDPDWTCSVDGFSLATGGNNGIDDTNRYILCSNDSLALGQHTVSIGVRSLGTPFWFDYIRYMPGPTVSNDSSVLIYDSLNANIQYDGTFLNSPNSGAHMTQTNAGALSVPFNGESPTIFIGYGLLNSVFFFCYRRVYIMGRFCITEPSGWCCTGKIFRRLRTGCPILHSHFGPVPTNLLHNPASGEWTSYACCYIRG